MDYLKELKNIPTQKDKPHKPLLILLCLTKILRGHVNKFTFKEIEEELDALIKEFTPGESKSGNSQYPFVFLQSSPAIWECSRKKSEFKNPDWPSKKEMENVVGGFTEGFYDFLGKESNAINSLMLLFEFYFENDTRYKLIYKLLLTKL